MDYGDLVTTTWRMTWRNRGLWLVGLFAGAASGTCSGNFNSNFSGNNAQDFREGFERGLGRNGVSFDQNLQTLMSNMQAILPLLIGIAAVVIVIYLVFWLLSIACKAAVITGGREAAAEGTATLGSSWSRGLATFGRLFALQLLWLVFWLAITAFIAWRAISAIAAGPRDFAEIMIAFFSLFGTLALVGIIGSFLGIGLAYAQRAIVVDGAGPIGSIGMAINVLRNHFGPTLLVWLIGLALSIGGGIALIIGLLVVLLPTLLIGGILGFVASLGGINGLVIMFSLAGLVAFVALMIGAAALNTFMWHYWTLAYLRFTGALALQPTPVPQAPTPVPEAS